MSDDIKENLNLADLTWEAAGQNGVKVEGIVLLNDENEKEDNFSDFIKEIPQIPTLDYSKGSTVNDCLRKYNLSHNQGWDSIYGSTALRFGSAFHAGMDGFYGYIAEHGWTRDGKALEQMIFFAEKDWKEESKEKTFFIDYRTFENLIILLSRYVDHFYNDEGFVKIFHTERAFKLLMKPTKEDKRNFPWLKPFYFTGKLDQECELNGARWINEFKTTGWSINQLKNQLQRSPQIIGYNYASRKCFDIKPEGNLVTIAYCTSRKSKATENYGKLTTDFARVPMVFSDDDLALWRSHFIAIAARVQQATERNYFPPNISSCYNYGRCKYLNICEQPCSPEKASFNGYEKKPLWDVTKTVKGNVIEGEE
jgi:hypothetical protein